MSALLEKGSGPGEIRFLTQDLVVEDGQGVLLIDLSAQPAQLIEPLEECLGTLREGGHELGFIEPGIGIECREHTGGGWSRGENTLTGGLAQLTVPGAGHTEDGATLRGPLVGHGEPPFRQAFEDVVDG